MSINWFMTLATGNSRGVAPPSALLWLAALGVLLAPALGRADAAATATEFAAHVKQSFQEAQARYQKAPAQTEAAWQFARACWDMAELATNKTQRASLAEQGIAACRQALEREPNSAPTQYYLGMNLGELAETRGLSALRLVNQMESAFSRARDLDERFDWAGPARNLGLLYRDAPAVVSVGSRSKAREHLEHAVKLAPQFPENRLNLIEAYLKWGELSNARRELVALDQAWPSARTNLVGVAWATTWPDWEARRDKARKKIQASPKTLGSPHDRR